MIQPIGDRIVVRQLKKEANQTIIVAGDDLKLPKGTILKIGDAMPATSKLQEGMTVYFNEYSGERIKVEDDEILLLNFNDILAYD